MKAFVVWWTVGFIIGLVYFGDGIAGVVAGVIVYLVTVQVWWRTPCRRCSGSPRFSDWASAEKWRPCPGCSGRGWVPRLFAVGRS